jgi:hypothetical protein
MLASMAGGGSSKPPEKAPGMKSAYELALERMEQQGIDRPREESLTADARAAVAEARQQAEAKLAEIEILHRDRMKGLYDPAKRDEEEQTYRLERRRIETERDRKIDKLRGERSA